LTCIDAGTRLYTPRACAWRAMDVAELLSSLGAIWEPPLQPASIIATAATNAIWCFILFFPLSSCVLRKIRKRCVSEGGVRRLVAVSFAATSRKENGS
jgi:hypothetical protein